MSIDGFLSYLRHERNRSEQTIQAYRIDLRQFTEYIATDTESNIITASSSQIRSWIASLAESGDNPATLRRKLQSLKSYYKYLLKSGTIIISPAAAIPMPRLRRRLPQFAKEGDMERMLADSYADPDITDTAYRDTLLVELLYSLGLRRAELLALSDCDIDHIRMEARITGKGNKTRIVPLPAPLLRHIRQWQTLRDNLWEDLPQPRPLASTPRGRMSATTLGTIVKERLQNVAATRKSPHTLRHTCATSMLNAGADITNIKELLGHASLAATQIYTHVSFADMKRDWTKAHPRSESEKTE